MTVGESQPVLIAVAGRNIEVDEITGDPDRRPLVLLHEGLGSVGLWRQFPEALGAMTGRRVISYSRFGHGHSDAPPAPRTPAFFHDEALEVLPALLEQLGASEPILVGHSDGGSIALIHAAQSRVTGLALIAPHVFVEDATLQAIRQTRDDYRRGDLRERMARHHADPDAAFRGWCSVWLDPTFRSWSIAADACRVSAPMLLIQGLDDPYGTLEQIDRIEGNAEGPVQRLALPAGHSPHLERPEAVVDAVARFVSPLP